MDYCDGRRTVLIDLCKEPAMRKTVILMWVMGLGSLALISGCVAVAAAGAGAGTIAYMRGDLESVETAKVDALYQATKQALSELEYRITKDAKDAVSAELVARDSQDKKIVVKMEATAEGATSLSIRVGIFGDEQKSRVIYDRIKSNLQTAPGAGLND